MFKYLFNLNFITFTKLIIDFNDGKIEENNHFLQILFENDGLYIVDNAFKDSIDKLF